MQRSVGDGQRLNSEVDDLATAVESTAWEIGQARLQLREGLRFSMRRAGGHRWYLVDNESRGQFFRIGMAEYTLLSLLDGRRTISEIIGLMSAPAMDAQLGEMSESRCTELTRWVIESGLVSGHDGGAVSNASEPSTSLLISPGAWNPLMVQIPLFNPDKIVARLTPALGWCFGWVGLLIWLLVCGVAVFEVALRGADFWPEQIATYSRWDWIWVGGTWMALKGIHELAHAIACKRLGGQVTSCGVLFLLFVPLPFVDVTSSWRMKKRWQRILIASAGMMAELFIAAIATILWMQSAPGPMRFHLANIAFAGSVVTILINANPLMRLDGYYIFSDGLELSNLYGNGRQFVMSVWRRLFFGPAYPIATSMDRPLLVMIYGFAAWCWSWTICVTLIVAALNILDGIGLVLAVFGGFAWLGIPLARSTRMLVFDSGLQTGSRWRAAAVATLLVCVIAAACAMLPAPQGVVAPAVVDFEPLAIVRADAPGFVDEWCVVTNQPVVVGQPLMRLKNLQLIADLDSVKNQILAAELRSRALQSTGSVSAWQVEQESVTALRKRKMELEEMGRHLLIRSPMDGIVISDELESRLGSYVSAGETVCQIADVQSKQVTAFVRQADVAGLVVERNSPIGLRFANGSNIRFAGWVRKIAPGATDQLPHAGLAASFGGELDVLARGQNESHDRDASSQSGSIGLDRDGESIRGWKLTEPRVEVTIELDAETAGQLAAGQIGRAQFNTGQRSLGAYALENASRWIRSRIHRTHGL